MTSYTQLRKERVDLAKTIPLEFPFSIVFEATSLCNFRCTHCYQSQKNIHDIIPPGTMQLKHFCKIVDDIKAWIGERKVKVIQLVGEGEPLLHSQISQFIEYASKMSIANRIEITSNASLLNENVSQCMIDNQIDYLRVSVYATNQEDFEKITNSNTDFNNVYNNVYQLKDLREKANSQKPFIYIKTFDNGNEKNKADFFEMFGDIADEIILEKAHSWLNGNSNIIACPSPFKMIFVHWDGECTICPPDYKRATCIGNAITHNIKDLWNGDKLYELQKLQLMGNRSNNPSCRTCSFLNENYILDNIDDSRSKILCRLEEARK